MVQELTVRGLCSTCVYRSDCFAFNNSLKEGKAVFHCEEFDGSESEGRWEPRFFTSTFATVQCFSMKNLIPGWIA